ncbi:MAG: PadR family transcriptional regulator [Gammaproteobacteria bacterium]|nr:PadR family transcriptional regulator [Gammaproteobacteria bacterium]
MSLPHIVLGLLDEPASGYDIKNKFNRSLVHFWRAELAQIYPTLKKLTAQGLLECQEVPSSKGPARKIYRRTARGDNVLLEWLCDPPSTGATRIPYLAQTYFLNHLDDPARTLEFFNDLKEIIAEKIESLQQANSEWASHYPEFPESLSDEDFYKQMTLENGLAVWTARQAWCEMCRHRIIKRYGLQA